MEKQAAKYNNYGGFREMTRDGKTVFAHAGGNDINPYSMTIQFLPSPNILVAVASEYHTLDEMIPVFNSGMH